MIVKCLVKKYFFHFTLLSDKLPEFHISELFHTKLSEHFHFAIR